MSIQQTREGFNYQDYAAVYVFLEEYLKTSSKIKEFYTDYLYDRTGELSHDVFYLKTESDSLETLCIEVKTGETFCEDRRQIGGALCEIYKYLKANTDSRYSLLVSTPLKDAIRDYWRAIEDLQSGLPLARITTDRRSKINLLKDLPELRDLTIGDDDFRDYLARLILMNPTDRVKPSLMHDEGIELLIESLIRRLGTEILDIPLEPRNNPLAFPHSLTQELIYITAAYAGTGTNVLPIYRKAIKKFFGLVQQIVYPDVTQLHHDEADIEKILLIHEGLAAPPQAEVPATAAVGTGTPQL